MSLLYTLAQLNPIVGDIKGNYHKICQAYDLALTYNSNLCITPELALIGYSPQDLVLKQHLIAEAEHYINLLANYTEAKSCGLIVGSIRYEHALYNVAYLIADGKIKHVFSKYNLPNSGVFDEKRTFAHGTISPGYSFKGKKIGLLICEDCWFDRHVAEVMHNNTDVLICINASPFSIESYAKRIALITRHTTHWNKPVIYVNQVGGQDSVIFDGGSFVMDQNSQLLLQAKFFNEEIIHFDLNQKKSLITKTYPPEQKIYQAVTLGLKDYVKKNGFSKVIIGLSGGIDSALTAVIATDAFGAENVFTYMLPSKFTSQNSLDDAKKLSDKLQIKHEVIQIESIVNNFRLLLPNISESADQNIQARVRSIILMALSNNNNALLIATGNKSEIATGYTTLYGDMCGAYSPIKDLYKTQVYQLCQWRNQNIADYSLMQKTNIIPQNILTKAPTAELRFNQTDQDNLPPYNVLDKVLFKLVEENMSKTDIIAQGYEQTLVEKIIKMLYAAEFKRHQSAPGARVSKACFNVDRRYPITNKFIK